MNVETNLLEDYFNFVDALLSKHVDFVVITKKNKIHTLKYLEFYLLIFYPCFCFFYLDT